MNAENDLKETQAKDEPNGLAQEAKTHLKELRVKKIKNTLHWMLFGAFLSILPLICSIGFRELIDYDFSLDENKLEYLSDFLLAVFAIASNACGCVSVWNVSRNSYGSIAKGVLMSIAILSMGACITGYAYFFNVPKEFRYDRINVVFKVAGVIGVINTIIGGVISWKDN